MKSIIKLAILLLTSVPVMLSGQVLVGSGSAALDIQSSTGGMLLPRLTTTERNNISGPAAGLMIFNTNTLCIEVNHGSSSSPEWTQVQCRNSSISQITCGSAVVTGTLTRSQAATGVSVSIPYTGGNSGVYAAQTIVSTGVTGLTATLAAGNVGSGSGNLTLDITGTPTAAGTAVFFLSLGGQSCSVSVPVVNPQGSVSQLNCAGATITGVLTVGSAASGVSASVPYTGVVSGSHNGQTVTSTGVTGLTATLSSGSIVVGAGSLSYAITGTPSATGTATFALNIGGQTCNLTVSVTACRAKVNATDFKNFLCYNLGAANTSADPLVPSWEINGGYWQWGRSVQGAAGPTGSGSGQANDGAVSNWNLITASLGDWLEGSKTANDPCPTGYRVPTNFQWNGVMTNNTLTNVGTFNGSSTNYGAGKKFGDQLMLPAAGLRATNNGALSLRGSYGVYWSSTGAGGATQAYYLGFDSNSPYSTLNNYTAGLSVRCIEE